MPSVGASTAVLVTGATGFIGRQVLRYLLAAERSVIAIARPREDLSAYSRVMRAIGHIPDRRQLEVIEADLANPQHSLTSGVLHRLRDIVETVIHCAGDTAFFPADMDQYRAGHIDGPLALLAALAGGRIQQWGYLSTAYVCGKRSGTVFEDEGDVGQDFHNPYERVKLTAETSMRAAGDRFGIDVRVFRPSAVVGPAPDTAGGQPSNLFFIFIRMMEGLTQLSHRFKVRLRIEAAPTARFNIVPVEYVARALVALADHPDGASKTFHLVVSDAPAQEAMLAMIADYFDLPGLSIIDACRTPLTKPSVLERQVARLQAPYRDYFTQDVHFDDRVARELLDPLGLPRPILDAQEVRRLIDQALQWPASVRSHAMLAQLLQTLVRRYADAEAEAIAPFLVGKHLLDLGAGEGYVTVALQRLTTLWVCAVDIGPYQRVPTPYLIYDGTRLPFHDASFDTTLISLALHHCTDPEVVLDEALRLAARRLIILESVYRNRIERFCLQCLDDWLSRYRHNGDMHPALAFKRIEEWQRIFAARSLETVDRRWLGSRLERLVHQPVLFVLEKPASHGHMVQRPT